MMQCKYTFTFVASYTTRGFRDREGFQCCFELSQCDEEFCGFVVSSCCSSKEGLWCVLYFTSSFTRKTFYFILKTTQLTLFSSPMTSTKLIKSWRHAKLPFEKVIASNMKQNQTCSVFTTKRLEHGNCGKVRSDPVFKLKVRLP